MDNTDEAACRLAIYGTLAPGRSNHLQVAMLRGTWREGTVRGQLLPAGWGATQGYPALILDDKAEPVRTHLLESPDLPEHWARLDAFEGDDYRRVVTAVEIGGEPVLANIYVLNH